MAARAAPPELVGFRSSRPSYGGMWACRPTAFGGGAAENAGFSGGYAIRPYGCMRAGSRCRGALYMRPGRTAGISGPSVTAVRSWRHGGMPPYGVRRGCGGKCRLFGRPYRPPLRGAFDLVRRAGCPHPAKPGCRDCRACRQRILPPFPAVGAACMAARTAPPELVGFRSSRPSYGGMGACRPTASGGGAAENAGFSGGYAIRPYRCARYRFLL